MKCWTNLSKDGFRSWRREAQVVNRVEASVGKLLDQSSKHDRLLRSILLTLADGDKEEVRQIMATIETGGSMLMPDMTHDREEAIRRKLDDLEDAYGPAIRKAKRHPAAPISR